MLQRWKILNRSGVKLRGGGPAESMGPMGYGSLGVGICQNLWVYGLWVFPRPQKITSANGTPPLSPAHVFKNLNLSEIHF